MKYFVLSVLFAMGCMTTLIWKWTNDINKVLVPQHVSLDTTKYEILKEDSLVLDNMKIKRVYYIVKRVK